jgi:hypothetical protein
MTPQEIEKRRDELLHARNRTAYTHPMPIESAIRAHNAELDRIDAELSRLDAELAKLEKPKTGEAAGIIAIGEFHGDPWSPPPREEPTGSNDYDPLLREYGERIK